MIYKRALRILHRLSLRFDIYCSKILYGSYFGVKTNSEKKNYQNIFDNSKDERFPLIDQLEKKYGFSLDKDWFYNLALHTQVVIKESKINYSHGRLLYLFLKNYIKEKNIKILTILETGTARGFSSLCMAKAIAEEKVNGRIITIDFLPHRTKMYWNCIDDFDGQKSRNELLSTWRNLLNYIIFIQGDTINQLNKIGIERVNFAFLDAQHTYKYVKSEFNLIKEKQRTGDLIFFDDVTDILFPGVVQAVKEIINSNEYTEIERIQLSDDRCYVIAERN